jgi:hypothetical protein
MTDRFKILGTTETIPWSLIEPHRRQAERNHYQTLERLNERGGLSYCELVAVLEDRPWRKMTTDEAWYAFSRHMRDWLAGRKAA